PAAHISLYFYFFLKIVGYKFNLKKGRVGRKAIPIDLELNMSKWKAHVSRYLGDMVMKPIQSITRDVIREFMINKTIFYQISHIIFMAFMDMFPTLSQNRLFIFLEKMSLRTHGDYSGHTIY
ncbi:hypothetical protein ACJX0J_016711, partial [Zea mays]